MGRTDFVKEAKENEKVESVSIDELDLPRDSKKILTGYLAQYMDASEEEKRWGEKKAEARDYVRDVAETLGVKRIHLEGVAKVSYVEGTPRTSFTKDGLVSAMLEAGIKPVEINKILNKAAKVTETKASVRITGWKEKD